jgi:peptide/nickel transport system permease protein
LLLIRGIFTRIGLIALTFVIIVVLSEIALNAAATRLDRTPFQDVLGRAFEGSQDYFASLLNGSLGEASSTSILGGQRRAMGTLLMDAYPKSMALVAIAVGIATLGGVGVGMLAATARGGTRRAALVGSTIVAISTPSFLLAALLVMLSAEFVRRFGIRLWPSFGFGWDDHLVLPVLVLAVRPFAQIANLSYVALDEVLRLDYIRTARAKGIVESVVLMRHALGNAAIPILGSIAAALSIALSTLPVVEVLFSWPGLGFSLLQAIRRFDAATAGTLLGALAMTIAAVRFALDAVAARYARRATGAST